MSKTWDKTDQIALAASVAAHAVLFGLLSIQLSRPHSAELPKPIAVEILAESDLEATSTNPSDEAPAAMKADEEGPVEDAPAAAALPEPAPIMPEPEPEPLPVVRPDPVPVAKPQPKPEPARKPAPKAVAKPKPTPKPAAKPVTKPTPAPKKVVATKPTPKPAPAKKATTTPAKKTTAKDATKAPPKAPTKAGSGTDKRKAIKPSGDLDGIMNAMGKDKGKAVSPPGKSAAQIRQTIQASIYSEVRPLFRKYYPTGPDDNLLKTTMRVRVNPDGSLAGTPTLVKQTGVTDSNRSQLTGHKEAAIKSIRLAAPFPMPGGVDGIQTFELEFQVR